MQCEADAGMQQETEKSIKVVVVSRLGVNRCKKVR